VSFDELLTESREQDSLFVQLLISGRPMLTRTDAGNSANSDEVSSLPDTAALADSDPPSESGHESEPDRKNGIVLAPYNTSYPPVMGPNLKL
jgi:hypothetical protein